MMSLVLSVERLESLIMVPVESRGPKWGYQICTASRFVHINVWTFSPKSKPVRDIIRLLVRAQKELLSMVNSGDFSKDKKKIQEYIDNIGTRIDNIKRNYLRGKPSGFAPDHKLSEP